MIDYYQLEDDSWCASFMLSFTHCVVSVRQGYGHNQASALMNLVSKLGEEIILLRGVSLSS